MEVNLAPGEEARLPAAGGHQVIAYLFEGRGYFGPREEGDGRIIRATKMLVLEDGDHVRARAAEDSHVRFMLMAGAPFNEPIVPYGPFVMNSEEEIRQAMMELRSGTFVKGQS
jgi:redox-sensitive bicupin YhaK (pirin superfamily)